MVLNFIDMYAVVTKQVLSNYERYGYFHHLKQYSKIPRLKSSLVSSEGPSHGFRQCRNLYLSYTFDCTTKTGNVSSRYYQITRYELVQILTRGDFLASLFFASRIMLCYFVFPKFDVVSSPHIPVYK